MHVYKNSLITSKYSYRFPSCVLSKGKISVVRLRALIYLTLYLLTILPNTAHNIPAMLFSSSSTARKILTILHMLVIK